MKIVLEATAMVAILALLGGCGEEDGPSEASGDQTTTVPSDSPTATPTPTPEWSGETIPDGTYEKTATMADASKLGLPKERAARILGRDGELRLRLRVAGDNFSQFGDDRDGPFTQGDGGTTAYDEDGNWVVTSSSTGCPGCVATVAWKLDGDRLTLRTIETTEVGDPADLLVSRLVYDGTWTMR